MSKKFIIKKRIMEDDGEIYQTVVDITGANGKHMTRDTAKQICDSYSKKGKSFAIQALTTFGNWTTLKTEYEESITEYAEDYFSQTPDHKKAGTRAHDETYQKLRFVIIE